MKRTNPDARRKGTAVSFRPRTGSSPALRGLAAFAGLALMAIAAFENYSDAPACASHWRAYFHLPGMAASQFFFVPIVPVVAVIVAAFIALAFALPSLRHALRRPWRDPKMAFPVLLTALVVVFSLIPWNFAEMKPQGSGPALVFYLITASCGFVLFLAGAYRELRFLDEPVKRLWAWLMGMKRLQFLLLAAGFTFVVANLISFFVFEHLPHIQDSIAQVFQARIFATGRFFIPSPPFPDFFDYTHVINVSAHGGGPAAGYSATGWPGPDGRWYSQYQFLHSLVILPFVMLGIPWVTNPLLGALFIPAVFYLGKEAYDERTGRAAALLACASPFILNMSAEFMNHSSALLFATLFILFFLRTVREGKARQALAAGAFLGMAADVRAYTALAICVPFAAYGLFRVVRQPGRFLPRFALMVLAAAAVASLTFLYNWMTNGSPMLFGYVVKWGPGHEVGFSRSGWGQQHTPLRGLINTGHDWVLVNKYLFEWPLPALLPIAALFAGGKRRRNDWLFAATFLCLSGAYFFYWFHNVCFGPRFLYEASACLMLLTARGFGELGNTLRGPFELGVSDESVRRFTGRAVPMLLLVTIVVGLPARFKEYHGYGLVDGRLERTVRRAGLHHALVFCGFMGSVYNSNTLGLDGDIVYAKDFGILNSVLTLAYPDRACYYANVDSLRPLPGIQWPQSRLRHTLAEMESVLSDSIVSGYRTLLWPFQDAPPELLDAAVVGPRLADYRDVSRNIFTAQRPLDDYLPALACWLVNDKREHLMLFSYMNDLESYVADRYEFTLLGVNADSTAALYDIRLKTGGEERTQEGAGSLPQGNRTQKPKNGVESE